jgi:hypothetical protein
VIVRDSAQPWRPYNRCGVELAEIVRDFAQGVKAADQRSPRATSVRSGRSYQPGLGPHEENAAVALVLAELRNIHPQTYHSAAPVPYPGNKLRCDLGIGNPMEWALEIKMCRAFGDNGRLDDSYLKDLLSPYDADHSALSDAKKLRESTFGCRKGLLVYGFEYDSRSIDAAFRALETLLHDSGSVGLRVEAGFRGLVHPVHKQGRVAAWEVLAGDRDISAVI